MSIEVIMPQMGESITEGTLTRWLKQPGESVARDEDLFEISTDKVDTVVPSPAAGILDDARVKEGETVPVGTIVCVIRAAATSTSTGAAPAAPARTERAVVSAAAVPRAAAAPSPAAAPAQASGDAGRVRSSPLVRRIAREHSVEVSSIAGTGLGGRITKSDILGFIESGPRPAAVPATAASAPAVAAPRPLAASAASASANVQPMSSMRKKIAEHMVLSRRTSAHVTTVFEMDMARATELRLRHKDAYAERHGVRLTFTAFIARAAIGALSEYPVLNASVDGDNVIYHRSVNLGIAVALDWGLIVPVIREAESLNMVGLARSIADLGERARTKRLEPKDVQGGTFTITNPGIYGGLFGTPIISQPQVAILGVGTIEKRPVVIGDAIAIRPRSYFALSFDHRIIDGAVADQFMARLKERLETLEL